MTRVRAKPYKAKSITGAERRVRDLEKQLKESNELLRKWKEERQYLARLAAGGPAFASPIQAAAAVLIRNKILATMNMNPDGSYIRRPDEQSG